MELAWHFCIQSLKVSTEVSWRKAMDRMIVTLSGSLLWQDLQIPIAKQTAGEPQLKPPSTWRHEIRGFEPDGVKTEERWVGTSAARRPGTTTIQCFGSQHSPLVPKVYKGAGARRPGRSKMRWIPREPIGHAHQQFPHNWTPRICMDLQWVHPTKQWCSMWLSRMLNGLRFLLKPTSQIFHHSSGIWMFSLPLIHD